jgi:hypothetical protein
LHLVGLSFVFQHDNELHAPPGCVRAIWPRRRGMECCIRWPTQSPNLNPIEMAWDDLDHRVREKQPTSAQHMWELLQDCWKSIPGEAGWENAKSLQNCHQGKGWLLWRNRKSKIYFHLFNTFFGYYMYPHVLCHSVDVLTIIDYYSTM